jgi:hypothetical protein
MRVRHPLPPSAWFALCVPAASAVPKKPRTGSPPLGRCWSARGLKTSADTGSPLKWIRNECDSSRFAPLPGNSLLGQSRQHSTREPSKEGKPRTRVQGPILHASGRQRLPCAQSTAILAPTTSRKVARAGSDRKEPPAMAEFTVEGETPIIVEVPSRPSALRPGAGDRARDHAQRRSRRGAAGAGALSGALRRPDGSPRPVRSGLRRPERSPGLRRGRRLPGLRGGHPRGPRLGAPRRPSTSSG